MTIRFAFLMQELVWDQRRLPPRIATISGGHGTCIARTSMYEAAVLCVPMQPWCERNCYTFQLESELGLLLVHGLLDAMSRPITVLQQGSRPLVILTIPAAGYPDNRLPFTSPFQLAVFSHVNIHYVIQKDVCRLYPVYAGSHTDNRLPLRRLYLKLWCFHV